MDGVERREKPQNTGTQANAALLECVLAFASAVKNLTIYPATHPRVAQRAADVSEQFRALDLPRCELTLRGKQLAVDGEPLVSDHLAVLWLAQRCREAGLRGIVIETGCTSEDVVRFAGELVACRPATGRNLADNWNHDTAKVWPLQLIVEDNHKHNSKRQVGELPPAAGSTLVLEGLADKYGEALGEIASRPQIQELLRQIEGTSGAKQEDTADATGSLDVIAMIGELLPAEIPSDPEELATTVEHILTRVHGELGELMRAHTRVKGADLLRDAVGVARNYFSREAPSVTKRESLPSGRPGDEQYAANLEELLAEYEGLPASGVLSLPPAAELQADGLSMSRELLGIYLYGLVTDESEEHRWPLIRLITNIVGKHKGRVADLLDMYLSSATGKAQLPIAVRINLLATMADAGLTPLLRARGFLSEDLITGGFPDVLAVAPRMFVDDSDLPVLRRALKALAPVLENGGAVAAAETGVLEIPATVALLTKVGGPPVLLLLSLVESLDREVQESLCEFAAGLELPPAEKAVIRDIPQGDVPPFYVRRLLRACVQQRFDGAMRQATADVIWSYLLESPSHIPPAVAIALVDALKHVPCVKTEVLLRRLSRAGRWLNFSSSARQLRRHARESLAVVMQRNTK